MVHWNFGILHGCFLKWWYPQNTSKWSILVGKPIVVGYDHFRKPPHGPPRLFLWKQLDMKVSEKMWQSLNGKKQKKIKAIASNAKIDREVHRGRYWERWHYSKWFHCWNKYTKLWGTLPYLFQYMNPIVENWNMQWVWQPIIHGNSSTGYPWQFHLWEAPLSQKKHTRNRSTWGGKKSHQHTSWWMAGFGTRSGRLEWYWVIIHPSIP